jgi:hypothetical protein
VTTTIPPPTSERWTARDAIVRAHTLNQDGGRDLLPGI